MKKAQHIGILGVTHSMFYLVYCSAPESKIFLIQ